MIVTGVQNTYGQFATQLQTDLLGPKGFLVWLLAIAAVGALGYAKDFRTFSHYFLALILIAMILSNKGFFQNLQAAIQAGPIAPTPASDNSGGNSAQTPLQSVTGTSANQPSILPGGPIDVSGSLSKAGSWFNSVIPYLGFKPIGG